jgi:hypothetical protein
MRDATSKSSGKKTADATIFNGRTLLTGVIVEPGTTATTLTLYDNTAASGTVLFETVLAANGDTVAYDFTDAIQAQNGIHADITGTSAAYIVYTG